MPQTMGHQTFPAQKKTGRANRPVFFPQSLYILSATRLHVSDFSFQLADTLVLTFNNLP